MNHSPLSIKEYQCIDSHQLRVDFKDIKWVKFHINTDTFHYHSDNAISILPGWIYEKRYYNLILMNNMYNTENFMMKFIFLDQLVNSGGFFIEQSKANDSKLFCNGVFGSKPNTPLLQLWNEDCHRIILDKKENIGWDEIGTVLLERYRFKKDYLFKQYKIIDGNSTVYPIHWTNSYQEFIEKPYENWKQIEREFQPVVIFNNEVYKKSEVMSECEILSKTPLSYFIKKSYLTKY
jgi:hypothetical protein